MTRLAFATVGHRMEIPINHGLREAQKLGTMHARPGRVQTPIMN